MAEFKFSCPHCDQHILVSEEHAGAQINCPACQKLIVVPESPVAAQPPPALARQGSAPAPAAARTAYTPPPAPRTGARALRMTLIFFAVVIACAALGGGGWYFYSRHKADVAARGNPAAQVPVPTAAQNAGALDILAKVRGAYTNLTSLSIEGTSLSVIDMSQVTAADMNPNASASKKKTTRRPANIPKGMTNSAEISIKLARPGSYCIQGTATMKTGRSSTTNTFATWSSGGTNYSLMIFGGGSYKNFTTVKDRKTALTMGGQAGALAMATARLFFDEGADELTKTITDWGQTADESVNGQDCYTLVGKMMGQKLKVWANKTSYMVLQLQITLGGPISDQDIQKTFNSNANSHLTQAQRDQMEKAAKQQAAMMTKIRGTVTETYDDVQMNPTLTADDFNYPVPRGVRLTASSFDSAATSTEASQRNADINNLRQIDAAKQQWALENGKKVGDLVTEADITPYLSGGKIPKSPAGGKYTIGKVGENPTCSIPGHELP